MPLIAVLLSSLAIAGQDPEVVDAVWISAPAATAGDYPRFAGIVRAEGHVVVQCEALPTGALSACTAMSEKPADLGFGREAVRVVQRGVLAPQPWMEPRWRAGSRSGFRSACGR